MPISRVASHNHTTLGIEQCANPPSAGYSTEKWMTEHRDQIYSTAWLMAVLAKTGPQIPLRRIAPADDSRVNPDPFAVAELSTNYTAPLADLDYRALMLGLPVEDRRPIIAERVQGDPETGLPHRWPFRVSVAGFSATCAKLDIGRGGPGAQGVKRSADLFWVLAAWLGVENTRTAGWSGIVRIDIALP